MKFNQKYTISDILTNGFIFTKMVNLDNTLNYVTVDNCNDLDVDYYVNYANNKDMSVLSEALYNEETAGNIADALSKLASICLTKYNQKWSKMFAVLNAQYDALSDIDYTELETPDITESTNIDTSTEQSGEDSGNLYGFNSEQETPANTGYSSVNSHNTADAESNYKTRTGSITRTKNGNLQAKQDLLKKELDARKILLYNMIYSDIDEVLTLPIWL